ncbi:hypothetical protein SH661x_000258 [Planctomicrobium sp. SH661]|uniref:hypothetical protein n=1 Tax=Planctomicrobium sp. SH661 TaxID=3448124 RepID=UPI003F5BEE3A
MNVSPLLQHLEQTRITRGQIREWQREIQRTLLTESRVIDAANFTQFHPADLQRLFDLYDSYFFAGNCRQQLGKTPLKFRISSRMTSAGGKTTRFSRRSMPNERSYEITISSTLLFQTFRDVKRTVRVTGLECRSRIEALQRIFEHELIHLIEMLVWEDSNCSAQRFQSIAAERFGHTEHRHALVTPRERASTQFGLKPGTRVAFRMDGTEYVGIVNRITKRATVLVEDPRGQPYSNGRRYSKFYVPFELLRRVS